MACGFQFGAQFGVIVNLTIECKNDVPSSEKRG